MAGYGVRMTIDMIDEICNNPAKYDYQDKRRAMNDAEQHYLNGNASKAWYESVVRILSA